MVVNDLRISPQTSLQFLAFFVAFGSCVKFWSKCWLPLSFRNPLPRRNCCVLSGWPEVVPKVPLTGETKQCQKNHLQVLDWWKKLIKASVKPHLNGFSKQRNVACLAKRGKPHPCRFLPHDPNRINTLQFAFELRNEQTYCFQWSTNVQFAFELSASWVSTIKGPDNPTCEVLCRPAWYAFGKRSVGKRWVVWDEWCELVVWDEGCEMSGVRWVVWDELWEMSCVS